MDREEPDTWLTLDQVRSKMPKSNWTHNKILELVDAALALHRSPNDFLSLDSNDQATVIAYHRVTRTMRAYDDFLAAEAARKK